MLAVEVNGSLALEVLEPSEWLSREDTLALLDRCDQVLWKRVKRGELRPVRFNNRVFYRRSEVERMAAAQDRLYQEKPAKREQPEVV
jgi:hypothetical protein